MMSERMKKTYRLTSDEVDYINHIAQANNTDSTKALQKIISEHKDRLGEENINALAAAIVSAFDEKYKNVFTRIRLAAGASDKNILILMEIINSMLVNLGIDEHAHTSRLAKSDVWEICEQEVNDRISLYKQLKDNKNKR